MTAVRFASVRVSRLRQRRVVQMHYIPEVKAVVQAETEEDNNLLNTAKQDFSSVLSN